MAAEKPERKQRKRVCRPKRLHRRTGRPPGRPRVYDSPEQMAAAVEAYFDGPGPHNVYGLVLALGFCHYSSLEDYETRDDPRREEYRDVIAWAKLKVKESYTVIGLTTKQGHFADRMLTRMGEPCTEEVKHSGNLTLNNAGIALGIAHGKG